MIAKTILEKNYLVLFLICGILIAGFKFRYPTSFSYYNPDEIIGVKVTERMINDRSLDTNWKLCDLPDAFKYPQYNFSGYHIFCYFMVDAIRLFHLKNQIQTREVLRILSMILMLGTIIVTFLLGSELINDRVGIISGLLVSLNALLYQDSLYARPEAFFTLLLIIFLYILFSEKLPFRRKALVASFILGILVGTKISMILLTPILLFSSSKSLYQIDTSFRDYIKRNINGAPSIIGYSLIGILSGILVSEPFALINYKDYISGVQHLVHQYTTFHWPHGLPNGSIIERINYSWGYFLPVFGIFFLASIALGLIESYLHKKYQIFCCGLIFSLFALRFSTYPVFFERNFSHLIPLFCILSAYGIVNIATALSRRKLVQSILEVTAFILCAAPSLEIIYKIQHYEITSRKYSQVQVMRTELEKKYSTTALVFGFTKNTTEVISQIETFDKNSKNILVEFPYPEDKESLEVVHLIRNIGFIEVGRVSSPFSGISTSTLHTYFTPTTIFFVKCS